MSDTDKQTIKQAAESIAGLLAAHWNEIREFGEADEKAMASVGITLKISFAGKVPKGVANISFATRIKDQVSFSGEQMRLKGVES